MKKNVAVSVENVGMRFNLNQERVDNLKEYVIKFLKRDLKYSEFWALKDINFEIKKRSASWCTWTQWFRKEYAFKGSIRCT